MGLVVRPAGERRQGVPAAAWAWSAAALGLALSLWLLQPGFLSWDSTHQWMQARSGVLDDVHPPIMAWQWRLSEWVVAGPLGMLALQAMLYWLALGGLGASLPWRGPWRAAMVLVIGCWPPLFALLGHIWKDVPCMAVFALAVWALRCELRRPGWPLLTAATVLLGIASAYRHNAITGALPLLCWIGWRASAGVARQRWTRALLLAALAGALAQALSALPSRLPGVRRVEGVWAAVALWDLAAVSLRERRSVFPPALFDPRFTLDALRPHFSDYSNTTVMGADYMRDPFGFDREELAILGAAWLRLPFDHFPAWASHRGRLSALLFGWDRAGLPDHQVLQPGWVAIDGAPTVDPGVSPARDRWVAWIGARIDSPWFAGWLYLAWATALATLAALRLRRGDAASGLALGVALSALSYALPLGVLSGSAEFRYLAWPILAALLAAPLLTAPADRRRAR